ncbi:transglutaminaseTgpA domain-containing protein [Pokkaliibacter sp. CJK22405]|uniref:transglutaminase family protein n=1 Tax=Pokkaliibacter sp. CJK22405 TaxID=3384615 RepID=UPI0039849488
MTQRTLLMMAVAQSLTLLCLYGILSASLVSTLLIASLWRWSRFQSQWQRPSLLLRLLLAIAGGAVIALQGTSFTTLEGMSGVLALAFALKSLELVSRRDAWVVGFCGLFVLSVSFLFSQSFLQVLLVTLAFMSWLAAFVSFEQGQSGSALQAYRTSAKLLGMSLPIMLLCYLFFPRLPPLWSMPMQRTGVTGISDTLSPGSIASLAQSSKLAFRAQFTGMPVPPPQQRYWRGLVLSRFDGTTWAQGPAAFRRLAIPLATVSQGSYEILMSPTEQSWLFVLEHSRLSRGDALPVADETWTSRERLDDLASFSFVQDERYQQTTLPDWQRQLDTYLPGNNAANSNPRLVAFGRQLAERYDSSQALINAVMQSYRQQPFYYTLTPPAYDNAPNGLDRFYFDERQGFCGHYASSLAVILRAAGLPSRVISGYQGGEWNAQGQFIEVRQSSAHAWVEVWIEYQGWRRLDPTAMVAPERINQDRNTLTDTENPPFASHLPFFLELQQQWSSWEFLWQQKVVNYEQASATQGLLQRLKQFTLPSTDQLARALLDLKPWLPLPLVLLLALGWLWQRRPRSEATMLNLLRERLSPTQTAIDNAQTPEQLRQQLLAAYPQLRADIQDFFSPLQQRLYQPEAAISSSLQPRFRRLYARLRRAKKSR